MTVQDSRDPMDEAPEGPTYRGGDTLYKPARVTRDCQSNTYLIQTRILTRNSTLKEYR